MPHVLEARSGDSNARIFLRCAVLSENWAEHACQIFMQDNKITFAQLHASLISAMVTESDTGFVRARAYRETQENSYVDFIERNTFRDSPLPDYIWYV